jgi:hypothetical protein
MYYEASFNKAKNKQLANGATMSKLDDIKFKILTKQFIDLPEPPKQCKKCNKSFFKHECKLEYGTLFRLYCCPENNDIILFRELNL